MSARRTVATVACGAALVALGAAGSLLLHSPDETVTADVEPTTLTAPVESRVVQTEVTGTGTVTVSESVAVHVVPPAGMSAVVTGTPVPSGSDVPWCTPLIEVSGRPVIALRGTLPAFRDLTVGDRGGDVRQLQTALRECGYPVTVDGELGARTAAAVAALYRAVGFPVVTSPAAGLGGTTGVDVSSGQAGEAEGDVERVARALDRRPADGSAGDEPAADDADGEEHGDGSVPTASSSQQPAPAPSTPAPQIVVPRGEVAFLPGDGRLATHAPLGGSPGPDPVATVALTGDAFVISLTATQRAVLTEGLPVDIAGDSWAVTAVLPVLPDSATTDENGMPAYLVSLPIGAGTPPDSVGQQGAFTIAIGSSDPYDRVVPVSALHQDTDATTFVRRVRGDETERIAVQVVAAAGGYSAVDVLGGGELAAGDQVVIGE